MDRLAPWLILLVLAGCASDAGTGTTVPPFGAGGAAAPAAPTAGPAATPAATTPTNTTPATPGVARTGAAPTTPPGSGAAPAAPTAPGGAPVDPAAPTTAMDPAACRGIPIEGLIYSPGGTELPNKCMPFHPTTNNPYAVRCVDVWPWYKTNFPGDQYCILPPPPDKGVQYGVHPQGKQWFERVSKGDMSGYENLSDEWTMKDGQEEQFNYTTGADVPAPANFYRNYPRMRPGSHHMIVSAPDGTMRTESWGPAAMLALGGGNGLPGAQRPDENAPKSLEKPAEDSGLFAKLPANPGIVFNMHHFNASGSTILKEAWTNLWWEEDARIEVYGIFGLDVSQVVGLALPPGTTKDLHYSWNITQPIRLVTLFGHRHAWTSNFSAWVENPDGKLDILYQSFEWLDEPTYRYDSMTMNPAPSPATKNDGASSGIRTLMPGQKLHFNCHIEFTDERAKSEGAPMPADVGPLRFANEAFTAEMCILFGSTAAVRLARPAADSSALPDFATAR